MEDNQLTDFQKVLLGTQTVYYLASNLDLLIRDYKTSIAANPADKVLAEALKEHEEKILSVVSDLTKMAEGLADYFEGRSAFMKIDSVITGAALETLIWSEAKAIKSAEEC